MLFIRNENEFFKRFNLFIKIYRNFYVMHRGARVFAYNFAINSLCKLSIEHEGQIYPF